MWPRSDLTDLVGIKYPIVQAPMAGSTTPALAAAVSEAGGLGSLGCAAMSIEDARAEIEETRHRLRRLGFSCDETPVCSTGVIVMPIGDDPTALVEDLRTHVVSELSEP